MFIKDILTEREVYKKITDPKQKKMIALAMYHDSTLPMNALAKLGRNPSDDDYVKLLSNLMDKRLADTEYGDISLDGKYDQWLTKLYTNGNINWEDLSGEGADILGAFRALSVRGILKPEHQDINRFKSLKTLIKLLRTSDYTNTLRKIQGEEKLKELKKNVKETVLINNENFLVSIPYNYGSCYVFNNEYGVSASFCTGSSDTHMFSYYAKEGPMIDVFNKKEPNTELSKYQIHAPSDQIKSATQQWATSNDEYFSNLYPDLLKLICDSMLARQDEIKKASIEADLTPNGYDVPKQVELIKNKFPLSYASKPKIGAIADKDASPEELEHLFGRDNY
jgi:hypothetical protein